MSKSDDYYLEQISRVIFGVAANEDVVSSRWEAMKKAFSNFNVNKVAHIRDNNIFQLIKNPEVIRDFNKIKATVENAQELKVIQKKYGSVEKYLGSFRSRDKLIADLADRIHLLNKAGAEQFLANIGYNNG